MMFPSMRCRLGTLSTLFLSGLVLSGCPGTGGGSSSTLTQEAYLKAPNAESNDVFGWVVAASGNTIVVGAIGESSNQTTITNGSTASADNSVSGAGAAYVFVRSGSSWTQEAYLKAPNAGGGDVFGSAVGISGDTIVVGASGEDSNQTTITNGTTASADNSANEAGAAYVFVRSGTTWTQQAYLKAPNAGGGDEFGSAVAISGDTIVVGAYIEDSNQTTITNGTTASADNSAPQAGAAYIFVRSGTTWTQEAYLKAPNAESGDVFGRAVAISGDTIVVGALGEDSNQTTITNGTIASADNSANEAGAAYVFVRSGTTWTQQAYLKAPNVGGGDEFGSAVAISGDTIVVGASGEDSNQTTITNGTIASADDSANEAGAAYVFVRSGTTWTQQAYLKAPNAENGDFFGRTVAVSGDTIVIGASAEDSNQTTITNGTSASSDNSASGAGAAYVFVRSGGTWTQQAYLKAPNAESGDSFGQPVAVSGGTIVVGATGEDSNQTAITNGTSASSDNSASGAGAAYVFILP